MNPMDRSTQLIGKMLDLLQMNSPTRTGLGVAIGLSVHVVMLICEPMLKTITYLNLTQLPFWGWPIIGIVLMNGRTIISAVKEDTVGHEQVDLTLKLIRQSNIPEAAKQQQYAQLIRKVIEGLRFTPKKGTQLRTD